MVNEAKLNKYYSAIAEKMDEMIPCEWERIVLRAEESGSVSSTGFYFYTNNNEVHWSYGKSSIMQVSRHGMCLYSNWIVGGSLVPNLIMK